MLSLADGLDCNCSGASTPFSNFPSGVTATNSFGSRFGGGYGGYGGGAGMMSGPLMGGAAGGRFLPSGHFPGGQMYFPINKI